MKVTKGTEPLLYEKTRKELVELFTKPIVPMTFIATATDSNTSDSSNKDNVQLASDNVTTTSSNNNDLYNVNTTSLNEDILYNGNNNDSNATSNVATSTNSKTTNDKNDNNFDVFTSTSI